MEIIDDYRRVHRSQRSNRIHAQMVAHQWNWQSAILKQLANARSAIYLILFITKQTTAERIARSVI